MQKLRILASYLLAALLVAPAPVGAFVAFETGPVRPVAKSPDGSLLFVCNIPDNRLEVFEIGPSSLTRVASIPVGLEPVSVAARTNTEVWVVNFLSDSVSIVDLSDIAAPRVTRTLLVGDEPRVIVFGGPAFDKAFITAAHRGQNNPNDPQLTTQGVGRADVWVFDTNDLGPSFGGDEKTVLTLFGDTPRPLAVSPDGSRVYAGVFLSGNQTTTVGEGVIPDVGPPTRPALALPPPDTNYAGSVRPEVGLIVRFDGSHWVDELGRNFDSLVRFRLPDYDVFAIDATQSTPIQVAGSAGRFAHVGTTLFNMAVHPTSGKVFVSNLEAFNDVRFEGPGTFASSSVRGHLVESRITIIDPATGTVTPRHLNKHITYDDEFPAAPNATNARSLAFPLDVVFTADGSKLYVAAWGSGKIGTFATSELESDAFTPNTASQIQLTGGGPAGIVLDEATSRLFVLTRFDNSVSIVNTAMNVEIEHVPLHNPEPPDMVAGRPFLYDASQTSSRGDQACASCHIFGDLDGLAWDLGNPDANVMHKPILNPPNVPDPLGVPPIHPMKGPMVTQSLRGMDNHGSMHWRGDRTGGNDQPSAQPDMGEFNEELAFEKFNAAFESLVGRDSVLADDEIQRFAGFVLQVMYPPNPIRALDNSLDETQASGEVVSSVLCENCHVRDREGNPSEPRKGFFGTEGLSANQNETQFFKVPQLRNLYQKVGMFGRAPDAFETGDDHEDKGDQVRGFGFTHDGSFDTIFRFLHGTVFNPQPDQGLIHDGMRTSVERFLLAFDSNHRPIVGQQVTISANNNGDADARLDLILERADAGECDAVAKGVVDGEERGWVYDGDAFASDRAADSGTSAADLKALAQVPGQPLTFTAVPVGEGRRIGVDRDLDGFGDTDERDAGSDPSNTRSLPCVYTETDFPFRRADVRERRGQVRLQADVVLGEAFAPAALAIDVFDDSGPICFELLPSKNLTANQNRTKFKFVAPAGATGLDKLSVKEMHTPGTYRVTLLTRGAWTPPAADETPATTRVVLHVGDECFAGVATKVGD